MCTTPRERGPSEHDTPRAGARTTPTQGRSPDISRPVARKARWTDLDVRAVDTVRVLAADAVQKAGNGHPGTAMSLAPVAYLLFQNVMTHDPSDPTWLGRDRFVLSCGHSSLTQYIQLYLSGYGLELKDLKALRTWGSLTPGHPEVHHTKGVEITTGPLGSGLASAVGMAMAQRRQRGLLDPDAKPGQSVFDHHVWVLASDGDLMEGVASEASSLAGHQELGNLTVVYDANQISIEDDTDISFSEDVAKRYEAYGWEVVDIDWRRSSDPAGTADYIEDVDTLLAALEKSKKSRTKPTLVRLHTVIAWPAPTARGTGKSHGSALGDDEIAATKELLGFDPKKTFEVDKAVLAHAREVKKRGKAAHQAWNKRYAAWRKANAERAALLDRLVDARLPDGFEKALPVFPADAKGIATRAASGKVLGALAAELPELWGGSADLAESNNTTMAGEASFIPKGKQTHEWKGGPYGRTLHFGIRENAMGMILNGIALEGLTRPYGGTFLVFSDYMRPAVRLAAIQQVPVTFVWTHDSIGLGEDGPTHQPIEHLAALRAMPGLDVVRPADANETAQAWAEILRRGRPGRPGAVAPEPARPSTAPSTPRPPASPRAPTCSSTRRPASPTSSSSPPAPRSRWPSRPACAWRSPASPPAWSRCRAGNGSRSSRAPTRTRSCRPRCAPASASRPAWRWGGTTSSATPAAASASSTSVPRRMPQPCSASSVSPPRRSSRPPRTPSTAVRKAATGSRP